MSRSSNKDRNHNVNLEQEHLNQDSHTPNTTTREITISDVFIAVEKLSTRINNMEVSNKAMLTHAIEELKKHVVQTPNPKYEDFNVNHNFGYSPDVEDNMNDLDKTTGLAKGIEKLKNFETINISDDTDEEGSKVKKRAIARSSFVRSAPESKRQNTRKGKEPMLDAKTDMAKEDEGGQQANKPFNSDYRRGFKGKEPMTTSATMPRRLSFTSSPGEGSKQKACIGSQGKKKASPKSVTAKKTSPAYRVKGGVAVGRTSAVRNNTGIMIPKHFRCAVKPTADMKLDQVEIRVCAYVFQDNFDSRDTVFKVGKNEYTRAHFECMCPGMLITTEIILMMALKVSWTQHNNICQTLWCLPPSFADDVSRGDKVEDLHAYYGNDWMPRFDRLRLIYVPIEDNRGHWYLMVISIDDAKIYQCDSYLRTEDLEERRINMRNIGVALSKMIEIVFDGCMSFCALTNFQYWDIEEARGIPNCGTSDSSAVWVVEWLTMQNSFTSNMYGVMDENATRMMTTMQLLMGNHNECNNELIRKAREHWNLMSSMVEKK